MSLIRQTIFFFDSMDLDSQPKPLSELISLVSQKLSGRNFMCRDSKLASLFHYTLNIEPEPELMSLIHQICSLAISMDLGLEKFISSCPQVEVTSDKGDLKLRNSPPKDTTSGALSAVVAMARTMKDMKKLLLISSTLFIQDILFGLSSWSIIQPCHVIYVKKT